MTDTRKRIRTNQRLFQGAVEKAYLALKKGDLQSVIAWSKIAAHFAFVRHPGFYMNKNLEDLLLEVAHRVEIDPPDVSGAFYLKSKPSNYGKMRFLHIITESYGTGGHSAFIARWIKNTLDSSVHSIIATTQNGELSDILVNAIKESGGWYCSLSELTDNLVEQALLMRLLAQSWTDVIVLLVHPFDPLPNVAFGIDGGPPIIFCNHSDHAFWLGGSIADIITDYHPSGGKLSSKRRGRSQSKILPIPLERQEPPIGMVNRQQLGLSNREVILLTVGRQEKFLPYNRFDFLEVMVRVLKRHPNVLLLAVGPQPYGRWQVASSLVEGRIKALGTLDRSVLEKYYSAADLYIASFPCGSGTSMLEAALHNLPVIGLWLNELPHISLNDDVAFERIGVHASSIKGFEESIDNMINDLRSCRERATKVKENIEREHCSPGWNTYLDNVLQSLPSQHSLQKTIPLDDYLDFTDGYFEYLSSQMMSNELPEHSLSRLIRVYSKNLPKTSILNAQAKNLLNAVPKVDSLRRFREFAYDTFSFLCSIFS